MSSALNPESGKQGGCEPIIKVRQLSKYYRIGEIFRDTSLGGRLRRLFRNRDKQKDDAHPEGIWALKNVSFDIHSGEVVGIIGRNGAGKSTLLKILAGITLPTEGQAFVRGQLGALLQVGAGFHPEMTGRENTFLNGALNGLSRKEIAEHLDDIVEFAEIRDFFDTPVKHYSSGMYMRLAFSVAAHLQPDILLVDEVLAVGDHAFQQKCMDRLQQAGNSGKAILFVSHNINAVTRLCTRAILIENGELIADGLPGEVVHRYLSGADGSTANVVWEDIDTAPGDNNVRLRSVSVMDQDGQFIEHADIRKPVIIKMTFTVQEPNLKLVPRVEFRNDDGIVLFVSRYSSPEVMGRIWATGNHTLHVEVPGNLLAEGNCYVSVGVNAYQPNIVCVQEAGLVRFTVIDSMDGDSARGAFAGNVLGVVRPKLTWYLAKDQSTRTEN